MNKLQKTAYKPDYVSPPGETLQDTLDMLGLTQAQLAERTGRPKKTINEIIQGKAAITPETALQLELVLRVPASFWLAREAKYRAWLARQDENVRLDKDLAFLTHIPFKQMAEFGWVEKTKDKREQAKVTLSYFGVVSSEKIPMVEEVAFRRSEAFATNPWALAAWLRKGELASQEISVNTYNKERFLLALEKIRTLTDLSPKSFVPQMTQLCADAGVTIVFVRELPKTSVSGATRWLAHNRPLIQLSWRYKTDDKFWFAFFHECGHVIHEHAKREILLESNFGDSLDQREVAANKFATDMLIPPKELEQFLAGPISQNTIMAFAKSLKIAPSIVVGRLQHEGKIHWSKLNSLKKSVTWEDWPDSARY